MKKRSILSFCLLLLIAILITGCGSVESPYERASDYINQSKAAAYIDTMDAYVSSARTKVNEGRNYRIFNTTTLVLIPFSCLKLEYTNNSPFSDSWKYGYVGVKYSGEGYDYYATSQDGAGNGSDFISLSDMRSISASEIVKKSNDLVNIKEFSNNYEIGENNEIAYSNLSQEFKSALKKYNIDVQNVAFVSTKCEY